MTRAQVRIIFAALAAFVLFEFVVFSATKEEPYPAVIFPGFGTIPKNDSNYISTVYELAGVNKEGEIINFKNDSIFNSLPKHFHWFILKKMYLKAKKGDKTGLEDFKTVMKEKLESAEEKPEKITIRKLHLYHQGPQTDKKTVLLDELTLFEL